MRMRGTSLLILTSLFLSACGMESSIVTEPPTMSVSNSTTLVNAFGGDSYEITGHNLTMGVKLVFGDQACTDISYVSESRYRCKTPSLGDIGLFDVKLMAGTKTLGTQANAIKAFAVKGRQLSEGDTPFKYGMRVPFKAGMCGTKFVGLDTLNNRLMVWNSVPASSSTPFDYVIGQPSVYNYTANAGGSTPNDHSFDTPYSFACYSDKLMVADNNNRRVLIWNSLPTNGTTAADVVVGQPDFTSNTMHNGGITAQSLREIPDLTVDKNGRLYVVDSTNSSRVMIWNSIPTTNFAAADIVLGQTSFTASGALAAQDRLFGPLGILAVDDKLLVSDQANRVLIWNSLPATDTQPADLLLGQTDFGSSSSGASLVKFNRPYQMSSDGTRLVLTDSSNHRVLVWNTIPTASNTPADFVLGQATTSATGANNPSISGSTFNGPTGSAFAPVNGASRLVIADNGNNRIMSWSTFPTVTGQTADIVLGQETFTKSTSNWGGPAATTGSPANPQGAFYDGNVFAIADTDNNRVLIWKGLPATNTTAPDVILGQSSLTGVSANAGGTVAANTLKAPRTVAYIDGKFVVADNGNSRILIWDSLPTANQQGADRVLGQASFTVGTANGGGAVSASTMSTPSSFTYAGGRFYVADGANNRVLFWNSFPPTSSSAAAGVLGQPGFITNTLNNGGISAATMRTPVGIHGDGTYLAVADANNNRVLIYTSAPASSASANLVVGQPDFVSAVANNTAGNTKQRLNIPISVSVYNGSLYVTDRGNHRILRWSLTGLSSNDEAAEVMGQSSFDDNLAGGGTLYRLNTPEALHFTAKGMVVADKSNQRILVWPWP